jgi:PAS domain S-box-containing protein
MKDAHARKESIFFQCVESSLDVVIITDTAGVIQYVNPSFERVYRFSRAECIGRTAQNLCSETQAQEVSSVIWKDLLDQNIGFWKGEIVNRAKDGNLIPALLSITAFKNPLSISGFVAIAHDMRAHKALQEKIGHQERLAALGSLATELAHEIGTPLGVIRGRAELLLTKATRTNEMKNLHAIIEQSDRISQLIYKLLETVQPAARKNKGMAGRVT